jgi:hypothetical protein
MWYNEVSGRTFVYYDDGSSQQWVEFGVPPNGSKIALASYADSAARTTALPSPSEADLSYLQDTNSVEVYDGSAWAAVGGGGLVLIDETTVGSAVASVTMSSVFSATYDTYLVVINGVTGSTTAQLQLKYDAVTTNYYGATRAIDYVGALTNVLANNAAHLYVGQVATAPQQNSSIWIGGPYLAGRTILHGTWIRSSVAGYMMGLQDVAGSHSSFTIAPSSGTITGGTISTFGVAKS